MTLDKKSFARNYSATAGWEDKQVDKLLITDEDLDNEWIVARQGPPYPTSRKFGRRLLSLQRQRLAERLHEAALLADKVTAERAYGFREAARIVEKAE